MDGRTIALLIDSFWQILLPGLTVTIPLTAISWYIVKDSSSGHYNIPFPFYQPLITVG